MLIAILTTAALFGAGGPDPDAVVATAPPGHQAVATDLVAPEPAAIPSASAQAITPHGLTTDEQIDRWIAQRSAAEPFAEDRVGRLTDDRKIHGEVSAAIGTGDYTAYSAAVSIPVGESGRVDLSYSESRNNPYGYGYDLDSYRDYGYGHGRAGRFHGRSRTVSVGASFGVDSSPDRETPVWNRLSSRRADTLGD